MRSNWEKDQLVKLLKKQPYFKKQAILEDNHLSMITDFMSLQYLKKEEEIYHFSDEHKYFYIIIRGGVKLVRKNTDGIQNWEWAHSIYKSLKKWKQEEFDKKVEQAMHDQLVNIKLQSNVFQLMHIMNNKKKKQSQIFDQSQLQSQILQTQTHLAQGVRNLYNQAKINQDKKLHRRVSQRQKDELDKLEILEFWKTKQNQESPDGNQRFPCEKWVKISAQERQNLIFLDMFSQIKWFYEYE